MCRWILNFHTTHGVLPLFPLTWQDFTQLPWNTISHFSWHNIHNISCLFTHTTASHVLAALPTWIKVRQLMVHLLCYPLRVITLPDNYRFTLPVSSFIVLMLRILSNDHTRVVWVVGVTNYGCKIKQGHSGWCTHLNCAHLTHNADGNTSPNVIDNLKCIIQ